MCGDGRISLPRSPKNSYKRSSITQKITGPGSRWFVASKKHADRQIYSKRFTSHVLKKYAYNPRVIQAYCYNRTSHITYVR